MTSHRPITDAIRWVARLWIVCLGAVLLMRLVLAAGAPGQLLF